jgi:hypothetical protein
MARGYRASGLWAALEPLLAAHDGRPLWERAGSPLCRPIQWDYAFQLKKIADRDSFVTHFGKQVHWDGAKDEEAWVLIVGEGPGTLTLVEEAR